MGGGGSRSGASLSRTERQFGFLLSSLWLTHPMTSFPTVRNGQREWAWPARRGRCDLLGGFTVKGARMKEFHLTGVMMKDFPFQNAKKSIQLRKLICHGNRLNFNN